LHFRKNAMGVAHGKDFSFRVKKNGPKAYLNAFAALPKTMRLMYVHSYQSFVWNQMASERVELFGIDHPVPGDLVAIETLKKEDEISSIDSEKSEKENEILENSLVTEEDIAEEKISYRVKIVTEEDVHANTYQIEQVVLPLPGYSIQYPTHKIGERYREIITSDGLNPDNLRHDYKEYSLPGSYRKLIAKPQNLNYQVMQYDDYQQPLALTDLDILNGRPQPESTPEGNIKLW